MLAAQRGTSLARSSGTRSSSSPSTRQLAIPAAGRLRPQQPARASRLAPQAFMDSAQKAPAREQQVVQQQEESDIVSAAFGFVLAFFEPRDAANTNSDEEGLPEWATADEGGHGGGWVHSHIAERLATESAAAAALD